MDKEVSSDYSVGVELVPTAQSTSSALRTPPLQTGQ